MRNYFVAAGLNSIGILTGGGWGRAIAHWIVTGSPDIDVTGGEHRPPAPLPGHAALPGHAHGREPGHGLRVPLPGALDAHGSRACKRSPLHERLAAQGAWFKDVSGLGGRGLVRRRRRGARRARRSRGAGPTSGSTGPPSTGPCARASGCSTCRSWRSSRSTGPDAGALLDRLCANARRRRAGADHLHPVAQRAAARIEADVTVTKRAEGDFLVVASDTAHRHVLTWLRRHAGDARVSITDVTSGLAQLTVQGPRSREVLRR